MLADPQETSAADLVWDTGSGCWGEGETSRLSWLPGQVEGVLELTLTRMPWRPLAAAEDGNESAQLFPLPPTYSWRRETVYQGQGEPDWVVRVKPWWEFTSSPRMYVCGGEGGEDYGVVSSPPHTPTGLVTPVPAWHCWESWHGVGIKLGGESRHKECCAGLARDIFLTEFGW